MIKKCKIRFDVWEHLDIDEINDIIDGKFPNTMNTDIEITCLKITRGGVVTAEVKFKADRQE